MVNDKAGGAASGFFYVLALNIVDLHLLIAAALRIPGSQGAGFLKNSVRQLSSFGFDDNVRAGNPLGVKPPVAAAGKFKGDLLILP